MTDITLLKQFEHQLDPRRPEKSAKVLGYGEISTVLEIADSGLAYKRMPMFNADDEVAAYTRAFDEYVRLNKAATPDVILDNLLADQKVVPMIVIMPNGRAQLATRCPAKYWAPSQATASG